jgi:hypothetical protein
MCNLSHFSTPLAVAAKVGRALRLNDAPNRCAAGWAGLPFAAIDARLILVRAVHAMRITKVAQRRATERKSTGQGVPNASQQARRTRPADAVAARSWVDAGCEQRLAGVDVAGADDDAAAQQRGLDRPAAALLAKLGAEPFDTALTAEA